MEEKSYEALCEEQRRPYLQWLKKQEQELHTECDIEKGKQVVRLPFLSCEESWTECLEKGGITGIGQTAASDTAGKADDTDSELWLFIRDDGITDDRTETVFAYYQRNGADILYADEDYFETRILEEDSEISGDVMGLRCQPWFKPEYSPDTLRSFFYYGSIFAVRAGWARRMWRQLCWETGQENDKGVSIYEFMVYTSGQSKNICRIPRVLYTNGNPERIEELPGWHMEWKRIRNTNWWRQFHGKEITKEALVSIIIPSKDNVQVLLRCLHTLLEKTQYPQYELVIVDNGSTEENRQWITSKINELQEKHGIQLHYLYRPQPFNFSAMCNQGAEEAKGKYLLFLNDDVEIIEGKWLNQMMELAIQFHIGAVGARLLYPQAEGESGNRIQHAGITNMGIGPAHKLAGLMDEGCLYHGHNLVNYNMIAVTGACLLLNREKFRQIQGFDEELAVAYNDVELCFQLYEQGYLQVVCNDAVLLHHESVSRGQDDTLAKKQRLAQELDRLYHKHPDLLHQDPFYSPNLVQWKKDVEYSCEYRFPCDYMVTPQLSRKLPKAHENRWIRKLTGENQSMLQIDSVEVTTDVIEIEGWYVLREHDNALLTRWLLLKHEESGEVYQVSLYPKLREDVEPLFAQDARTKRVALCGIHALIEKEKLPKGSYTIGILVQMQAAGGLEDHGKRIQYAPGGGFLL